MSRDVYDQFRAAQEAVAAQDELKRMKQREDELARLAAEAEIRREKEAAKIQKEGKIADARELMAPVNRGLIQILEAIKTHDPRINGARLRGLLVKEEVMGTDVISLPRPQHVRELDRYESYDMKTYMQLRWGDKFVLTPDEEAELEHPAGKGIMITLFGTPSPDSITAEDFELISLSTDPDKIRVINSELIPFPNSNQVEFKFKVFKSTVIATADFIQDHAIIMPLLARALSDPIRRYFRFKYASNRDFQYYEKTDYEGRIWDESSVDAYGERRFFDLGVGGGGYEG